MDVSRRRSDLQPHPAAGRHRRRSGAAAAIAAGLLLSFPACRGAGAADPGADPAPATATRDDDRPSQQELMSARGFVRHRGAWRTTQEIEILERTERATTARKQWGPRLEKLRRRLDDPASAPRAAEELREIADPAAVPALSAALAREPVAQVRAWFLESLARVGTSESLAVVVEAAIDHPDADTRAVAAERLLLVGPRIAEPVLVAALAGPDNARVNRAADAIAALGLVSAAPALVEALETEHVVTVADGRQSGQTSVQFGNGGGEGLSLGGGPKRTKVRVRNESVLAALERLTGQDHRWNLAGWREWLGARDTAAPIDLRRSLPAGAAAEGGAGDAAAPRGTHGRR